MAMGTQKRAYLLSKLKTKQDQLALANAAYDTLLTSGDVESYTFDSGEGRQSTKRRSLEELDKTITSLERHIDALIRRLQGLGVMNMTLSRRQGA